ncbi:NAD-dependent malic enzyme [Klebsiella pneumoniae]|uniref:NAD-dependent malic enzyme n=1 Tax=Klebsiella pneumoniae TaxID=573 RepID=A0A377X9A0_KLEPN|nr:NAD-dependent malic enzyme [Klebsiella pneumoniae]
MHKHCPRPIVMPLSNPTSRVEATPQNILSWTDGEALVATRQPILPVTVKASSIPSPSAITPISSRVLDWG